MSKPFLSIDDQINLLISRGVEIDETTSAILRREGYYSIINGYKDPFIDRAATKAAGDDRYRDGTTFSDIYSLFCIDRDLRATTFKHLLQVEAVVRTVCSYTFAENHREPDAYLIQGNYCSESEFREFGLRNYIDNLLKLQSTLFRISDGSRSDSISHYRKSHGNVPIWVLAKSMTFGNIEHFFHLMKPAERRAVCKEIAKATGNVGEGHKYFDPKDARIALDPIVKFRNICAHDDRLYCAKLKKRSGETDYAAMLSYVELFLCAADYDEFLNDVMIDIAMYADNDTVVNHVIEQSGLNRLAGRISKAIKNVRPTGEAMRVTAKTIIQKRNRT